MATLTGTLSLASGPSRVSLDGTYTPYLGGNLGSTITIRDLSGDGGGGTVAPLRYLNVGGTATPIQ